MPNFSVGDYLVPVPFSRAIASILGLYEYAVFITHRTIYDDNDCKPYDMPDHILEKTIGNLSVSQLRRYEANLINRGILLKDTNDHFSIDYDVFNELMQ